jgi:hypothetical protein
VDFDFAARDFVEQRESQQQDLGLIVDRIVDHVRRRAYFFTRFVLLGIDSAEVEDLLQVLAIEGDDQSSKLSLTTLIDTTPVGFVGGYIVFRLKREPRLFNIRSLGPREPIKLSPGILRHLFPNLRSKSLPDMFRDSFKVLDALQPVLDFIDEIADRETKERIASAVTREIAVPTSGVFAEAILGRSIAAEKIDVTRYITWDLPNPNLPPNIADIEAGGRGQPIPPLNATIENGVLQIQPPTPLPDPTGFAAAFNTLVSGTLFRDMSKSDVLGQALASLASVAQSTAQQAGTLAGQAQQAALQAATSLAQEVAKGLSTVAGSPSGSLTEIGGKLNAGLPPTPPTPTRNGGVPTPRPSQGARPASQEFGTGQTSIFQPIRIDLRAFIPAPIVGLDLADILGDALLSLLEGDDVPEFLRSIVGDVSPVEIVNFGLFASGDDPQGDGSSFGDLDPRHRNYRAHIAGEVNLDPNSSQAFTILDRDLQPSFKWRKSDTELVAGKPAWFRRPKLGASPTKSDRASVDQNTLQVTVEPQRTEDPSAVVTIKLEASIPLFPDLIIKVLGREITIDTETVARLLPLLVDLLSDDVPQVVKDFLRDPRPPAISAEFLLGLDQHLPDGPTYQLIGRAHDGFPGFELYLNKSLIYHFYPTDPPTDDFAPLSLVSLPGSSGDMTVAPTNVLPVPPRPTD